MLSKNSRGQVIRIHTYTGQMRKHGSDRAQVCKFSDLDEVAGRAIKYVGPGYRVRKAR